MKSFVLLMGCFICFNACRVNKYNAKDSGLKCVKGMVVSAGYEYYFLPGVFVDSFKHMQHKKAFLLFRGEDKLKNGSFSFTGKELVRELVATEPPGIIFWDTLRFSYVNLYFWPEKWPERGVDSDGKRMFYTIDSSLITISLKQKFHGYIGFVVPASKVERKAFH